VRCLTVSFLAMAVALTLPAQKRWAEAAEYDLHDEIHQAERNPDQQVFLLREWESRYPRTDFQRERLISFVLAFQRTGKSVHSFMRATELLHRYSNDTAALLLVATIGPTLPSPSENQVTIIKAAASKLLSEMPSAPARSPASDDDQVANAVSALDPETERVLVFVRQLRKLADARPDPEGVRRRVAEAVLEWANSLNR
jgi:hypothetical protein